MPNIRKLSVEQRIEVTNMYNQEKDFSDRWDSKKIYKKGDYTLKEIAEKFGVSISTVHAVANGNR